MFTLLRRFFRWLWSLTPWGTEILVTPGAPTVFIVAGGAPMPVGRWGDLCMIREEDALYVSTKKGWEKIPVGPSEG